MDDPGDDPFLLTTCYAAGQCQGDLGCPHPRGCIMNPEDGEPLWLT